MSDFVKVGELKDFPPNETTGVKVNEVEVVMVHHNDKLTAFDDSCTHAHALLSGSDLEEGEIVCPLHGARFSAENGQVMALPAVRALRQHQVKIEGEHVYVKLNEN